MTSHKLPAPPELANSGRQLAFSEFAEGDSELYADLCRQFQEENGIKGEFDFFGYAATLIPPDFTEWEPFIVKLRAMGRWSAFTLQSDTKEEREKRISVSVRRATLMGLVVTRIICADTFPVTMHRSIQNWELCKSACKTLLAEIVKKELEAKTVEMEMRKAMADATEAARVQGIADPKIAGVYMKGGQVVATVPPAKKPKE
jgi:hypothetical protein